MKPTKKQPKTFKKRKETKAEKKAKKEALLFTCTDPVCGKIFGKKSNLQRHTSTVHEKKSAFACAKCKKTFTTKVALKNHENSEHSEAPIFYVCQYCQKNWKNSFNLKSHEKYHCKKNPNQQANKEKREKNATKEKK